MISASDIPVPRSNRNTTATDSPSQDLTNVTDLSPLSSSTHSQSHFLSRSPMDPLTTNEPSSALGAAHQDGEQRLSDRDYHRDSYTTYHSAGGPFDTLNPVLAPALDPGLVTSSVPSDPLPVIDRIPVDLPTNVGMTSISDPSRLPLESAVAAEPSETTLITTAQQQTTTTTSASTSAPAVTETDLTGGTTSSAAAPTGGLVGSLETTDSIIPEGKLGRRVLVLAMDDSPASQAALTWTLNQLVSPSRDHLIILTVAHYKTAGLLKTNEERTAKRELKAEEQAQIVVNYAAAHVAQWIESLKITMSFELVTLKAANGKVQEVITDYARDIKSSLLILGSHAGGTIRKTLFGSTAMYCLQHATTPVIVVREEGTVMAA